MKVKLKEISEAKLGYPFRERIVHNDAGKYAVVQMKDMGENCQINTAKLYRVDIEKISPAHSLQKGDVLFQNRGWRNCAAVVPELISGAVASSHLIVLRTKNNVLPEYLAWYLNDVRAQGTIKNLARGATIPVISKELLGELEIEVPELSVQQKIVELEQLRHKENSLVAEIGRRRDMMLGIICRKLAERTN
jgi:restriction endonuclease S subunit